jgi:hypothetical protein
MLHDNRVIFTNAITARRFRLHYLRLLKLLTILHKFPCDNSKFGLWVGVAQSTEQLWTTFYLTLQCRIAGN